MGRGRGYGPETDGALRFLFCVVVIIVALVAVAASDGVVLFGL